MKIQKIIHLRFYYYLVKSQKFKNSKFQIQWQKKNDKIFNYDQRLVRGFTKVNFKH